MTTTASEATMETTRMKIDINNNNEDHNRHNRYIELMT
ncbi:hypothetical protein A2U01_0042973, partial [Trifolium medium]|nr:hypothetical protein [Trifolium medium]